jgi:molecular chaperone GrpE
MSQQDSETEVSVGDNGRVGKEEASSVLFTALRSFKEALIDDDNVKFAEMDAFLLDDEINSLQTKITTLEAGLAAARHHILRIGAHSEIYKKWKERQSWWQMCKGMLWRACFRFLAS